MSKFAHHIYFKMHHDDSPAKNSEQKTIVHTSTGKKEDAMKQVRELLGHDTNLNIIDHEVHKIEESQKAWMNAYTKGSKSLQARLAKIHATNPEFQDFVKKHGFGGNLSVKQSGQQKKSSVATVKPVTDANPERGNLDRLALIKAAAEKQRDRRHAASNRVAFGGELGGSFSMPGSGFRTYRESVDESKEKDSYVAYHSKTGKILKTGTKRAVKNFMYLRPDSFLAGNRLKQKEGDKYPNPLKESKVEDAIKAHPGVSYYGGKSDDHFVELHKGYEMDGQRSFGNSSAAEAKKMLKHIKKVQATDEDIKYKDGMITMRKGGWIALRNGKQIGTTVQTDTHAKQMIDSTRKTLGQKTMDVLKKKKSDIARGLGRFSMATESAANRNRIRSWDSAILPKEHDHALTTDHPKKKLDALRAAGKHEQARELERSWLRKSMAKEKLPFTPDKPKKNLGIVVGKNDPGYSKARHLARLGLKKELERERINKTIDYIKNPKNAVLDKHVINRTLKGSK